jgi:hypothetical protein
MGRPTLAVSLGFFDDLFLSCSCLDRGDAGGDFSLLLFVAVELVGSDRLALLWVQRGRMNRRWSRTIYVGNLPGDIREREVEDLFYKVGDLFLVLS